MGELFLWKLQFQVCKRRAGGAGVRWLCVISALSAEPRLCVGLCTGAVSEERLLWAGSAGLVSAKCWNPSVL